MSVTEFVLAIVAFAINPVAGAIVFAALLMYHRRVR